jgi:hypothetical protein
MKLTNAQVIQRCRDRAREIRAESELRRAIAEKERLARCETTDEPDIPPEPSAAGGSTQ